MILCMPLEHAEDRTLCARMITEVENIGKESQQKYPEVYEAGVKASMELLLKFAVDHNATVQQFGRYPHRNAVMGRESTPEEVEYLKTANTYGQ